MQMWKSILAKIEGILKNLMKTPETLGGLRQKNLDNPSIISLLKIYKILLLNEKRFSLVFD